MHLWDDGTVGFLPMYRLRTSTLNPTACGQIMRAGRLIMFNCMYKYSHKNSYSLCEKDGKAEDNFVPLNDIPERRRIRLSKPTRSSGENVRHIICASGHYALEFLACDVRSACWQNEDFVRNSKNDVERNLQPLCYTPLLQLFACRTGVERVSYSLVCDHSQDCLDNSDEDFCAYLPCRGAQQFECYNKQVRLVGEGGDM